MRRALNLFTAYTALLLLFLLCIIWILRLIQKHKKYSWLVRANGALRRVHTPLCYALYAFSLLHGLFSSVSILSFNLGTICFLAALLLWLGHALGRKLPLPFMGLHRWLCVLCLCLTFWHVADCMPLQLPRVVKSWFVTMPTQYYQDGVYRAESAGYRKHLWVEVTVEGGCIAAVEVIEHYERGKEYYEKPIELIPQEIVRQQTTDVDVISGATMTSLGIMEATRLALLQAVETAP